MRKLKGVVLSVVLLFAITSPAFSQPVGSAAFMIGMDEYFVNGQVPGVTMDARPFIENDRTFVPLRYLGNALGISDSGISWDGQDRRVDMRQGSYHLSLVVGRKEIIINGETRKIDAAPVIRENRVYIPVRYVAEALGYSVDWNAAGLVLCWPVDTPKPDITKVVEYVRGRESSINQSENQTVGLKVYGQWERVKTDRIYQGGCWNDPCDVVLYVKNGWDTGTSSCGHDYGSDIEMELDFLNTSYCTLHPVESLTVIEYIPTIEISRSPGSPVLWKAVLPTLTGTFSANEYFKLTFSWGQMDLEGKQVPAGWYLVQLKPGTVRYAKPNGTEHAQTLNPALATFYRQVYIR